jgi:hypothetical protein
MVNFMSDIYSISASEVIIRVEDGDSGQIFERSLPLDYYENDNGIRLRGENFKGEPVEIAFLSEKALDKIAGLTGGGPDKSRCSD